MAKHIGPCICRVMQGLKGYFQPEKIFLTEFNWFMEAAGARLNHPCKPCNPCKIFLKVGNVCLSVRFLIDSGSKFDFYLGNSNYER
jgi:hypothetical protein